MQREYSFAQGWVLHMLAPDEGQSPKDTPAWQFFIDSSLHMFPATGGCLSASLTLATVCNELDMELHQLIPYMKVTTWLEVKQQLVELYNEYHQSLKAA